MPLPCVEPQNGSSRRIQTHETRPPKKYAGLKKMSSRADIAAGKGSTKKTTTATSVSLEIENNQTVDRPLHMTSSVASVTVLWCCCGFFFLVTIALAIAFPVAYLNRPK